MPELEILRGLYKEMEKICQDDWGDLMLGARCKSAYQCAREKLVHPKKRVAARPRKEKVCYSK